MTLSPIVPLDSLDGFGVGAILLAPEDKVLMQLRDADAPIWYPGRWGLFGGAVDPGETPEAALHRELSEEIDLGGLELSYLTQVAFDVRPWRGGIRGRFVFVASIDEPQVLHARRNLAEGADCQALPLRRLVDGSMPLVPYDEFALRLYHDRDHLADAAKRP